MNILHRVFTYSDMVISHTSLFADLHPGNLCLPVEVLGSCRDGCV